MKKYKKVNALSVPELSLRGPLGLTGADIKITSMPAGSSVPYIYSHKRNEEIYAILEGSGRVEVDGESVELTAGDWIKLAPSARRRFFAAEHEGIKFVCIQVRSFTLSDTPHKDKK